jgi:aerobic carbon-monoxide dehydrogenase medium subunit
MPEAVEYRASRTIEEACAALLEFGDDARVLNGGTAMAILMRQHLVRPAVLVGVGTIPELHEVRELPDGGLRIGAAAKLRRLERNALVRAKAPLLAEAIEVVATPRIRNMATLGGGLAHADPAQDPPVALCASGATVIVRGASERRIPATDFCVGYYENALQPGEIVVAVELPAPKPRSGGAYLKFLPRSVEDYGVVTAAAFVAFDDAGACTEARLALGAVRDRPVVIDLSALIGTQVDEADARTIAETARDQVDPIEDVRGSSSYKRQMAVVFARRALVEAAARATGSTISNRP